MNGFSETMTSAFPTLLLWAGASLVAILLLAKSMKRRRESLTETLKKHVTNTIGQSDPTAPAETKAKP